MSEQDTARIDRLLGFLEADPRNTTLMADAALAALAAGRRELTQDLIARHAALAPLPAALNNAAGVLALTADDLEAARAAFATALAQDRDQAAVGFNLAWTQARLGDWQGVVDQVDAAMAAEIPRAGALKVHALHMLDRVEDALAYGRQLLDQRPDDVALLGASALAAMDVEDMALAARLAEQAGAQSPEGRATLGLLALERQDAAAAAPFLEQALAVDPQNARARLGLGLAHMLEDRPAAAAPELDQAAERFGDHPGSWIAAGWAHYALGALPTSRARFEKAVAADGGFSEGHGGLAVIDVAEGRIEDARRNTDIALRLDRASLSGQLARSMLLAHDGAPEKGERLRERVIHAPMSPGGPSIAQAMTRLARRRRG